jgi:tryptophan 2-monooxygenase
MFIPPSAIDNLYEYTPLLNEEPLCKIPKQALGSKVAVIGAGAAGITVAYELLRMGLKPIIYEASPRIGGRLYSRPFEQIQSDHKPFAELGAMRIPLSSRVFFYYASKIKLNCDLSFPSHGDENTAIYYSEKLHSWGPHAKLPLKFKQTDFLWNLFSSQLVRPIREIWEEGDLESVKQLWQMYIDQYSNKSLYEVLRERSPLTGAHQISIFGASGMTSSGFSSVFQISFLELLRVLINGYSHNQVFS